MMAIHVLFQHQSSERGHLNGVVQPGWMLTERSRPTDGLYAGLGIGRAAGTRNARRGPSVVTTQAACSRSGSSDGEVLVHGAEVARNARFASNGPTRVEQHAYAMVALGGRKVSVLSLLAMRDYSLKAQLGRPRLA